MNVYRASEHDIESPIRTHPWTFADYNSSHQYIDFRREPERITDSLEDFQPWKDHPAIERFVSLLRWLNSADSYFETNDCAFSVKPNTDESRPFAVQASGRLMLFVSEMALTCSPGSIDWLMDSFGVYLSETDPLENTVVGIAKAQCFFKAVATTSYELVLMFWSWGNTDCDAIAPLEGLYDRVQSVCERVNRNVAGTLQDWALSPNSSGSTAE